MGKALKIQNWYSKDIANKQETILGAHIAWRHISEEKGNGVFALRDIKQGEIIEVAPVIPMSHADIPESGNAPDGYVLDWDEDDPDEAHALVLGYIMLYNHSKNANMEFESNFENYTITATAARDIKAGEELTWDYSCELWFDDSESA